MARIKGHPRRAVVSVSCIRVEDGLDEVAAYLGTSSGSTAELQCAKVVRHDRQQPHEHCPLCEAKEDLAHCYGPVASCWLARCQQATREKELLAAVTEITVDGGLEDAVNALAALLIAQ